MSILDYIYVLIIPLIPLAVGIQYAYAPLGGPLLIISLQLFLGVTVKSFFVEFSKGELIYPWLLRSDYFFSEALLFISIFTVSICLGYISPNFSAFQSPSHPLIRRPKIIDNIKFNNFVIVSIVVFIISLIIFLSARGISGDISNIIIEANRTKIDKISSSDSFGSTHAFITQFFVIPRYCLCLLFSSYTAGAKNKSILSRLLIILFLSFFEVLVRGKRDLLVASLLSLTIIYFFYRKKISIKQAFLFLAYSFVASNIFSLITFLRGNTTSLLSVDFNDLDHGSHLLPIISSTYFTDINMLAIIMQRMNEGDLEFLNGVSYLTSLLAFIPRFLWHGKPAVTLGIYVKNKIYGIDNSLGGFNVTMPGEAFINFGWYGLLIGLLYGFFLRKFETYILLKYDIPKEIRISTYSFLIVPLVWSLMQSSFSITVSALVVSTIFCVFINKYLVFNLNETK